jgi:hypothetical protein
MSTTKMKDKIVSGGRLSPLESGRSTRRSRQRNDKGLFKSQDFGGQRG